MIAFRTASGRRIDLERPRPHDIELVDVVRGLSNCCRFAGQLPRFYSVAQHSILVSRLVEPQFKLTALLHDASEAYLGDLSRNLKHHELLKGYRVLEERLQCAIEDHFAVGATWADNATIKLADNVAAIFEHVTMRERKQFTHIHDIHRMLDDGFIQGDLDELVSIAEGLPTVTDGQPSGDWFNPWLPWTPLQAEERFMWYFAALEADGA